MTDLPCLMLDADGQTTSGWWTARTWPLLDDGQLIGFVEWAEPHTAPGNRGETKVSFVKA